MNFSETAVQYHQYLTTFQQIFKFSTVYTVCRLTVICCGCSFQKSMHGMSDNSERYLNFDKTLICCRWKSATFFSFYCIHGLPAGINELKSEGTVMLDSDWGTTVCRCISFASNWSYSIYNLTRINTTVNMIFITWVIGWFTPWERKSLQGSTVRSIPNTSGGKTSLKCKTLTVCHTSEHKSC